MTTEEKAARRRKTETGDKKQKRGLARDSASKETEKKYLIRKTFIPSVVYFDIQLRIDTIVNISQFKLNSKKRKGTMSRLLTVAKYAELEGITKQAVYQRLKNENWKQEHSKVIKNRVFIDLNTFHEDVQEDSTASDNSFNVLLIEIEYLKKENETLHAQIEEKDRQINSLIECLQTSQKENSLLSHRMLLLESNVVEMDEPDEKAKPDQNDVSPKLIQRLFAKIKK